MFDVLEVEMAEPHRVRVLATNRDEKNANAISDMAVMRRGIENHFYVVAPAGKYLTGDQYAT